MRRCTCRLEWHPQQFTFPCILRAHTPCGEILTWRPHMNSVRPAEVSNRFARVVGIGHAAPPTIQTAAQLAPLIGRDAQWISEQAGVERRHASDISDDPAVLAAAVAKPILERHGSPDLVLNAGAMQRQLLPDMSSFILRELDLVGIPGFTINATCLSFIAALQTATALIRDGAYESILICSSEFGTRGRNFEQPESAALIGDGAGVALVQACSEPAGIEHFKMQTWPEASALAEVRGGGVMRPPSAPFTTDADNLFSMDGEKLLRFVMPRLRRFMKRFLQECSLSLDDIDLVVPHQTSASGMKALDRLGIPKEKVVNVLADYGNCVAASLPLALSIAHQRGRVQRGDRVLLLGTAAGLSIGAAILRW